jgi:hypothetical protein
MPLKQRNNEGPFEKKWWLKVHFKLEQSAKSSNFSKKQNGDWRSKKEASDKKRKNGGNKGKFTPRPHCKKISHSWKYCWYRPVIQIEHVEKVCKNKQQGHQAKAIENQ